MWPPTTNRSLVNGLAQVIVQSSREPGEIVLSVSADGITPVTSRVHAHPAKSRPEL